MMNLSFLVVLSGLLGAVTGDKIKEYCQSFLDVNLFETILHAFLTKQDSITVFNVDQSLDSTTYDDLVLQMMQSIKPVRIFDGMNEEFVKKYNDMGDELNLPSDTKSYFVLSTTTELLRSNLHFFSRINANGKWIFVIVNVDPKSVELLLINAWNEHKMANILVIFSDSHSKVFIKDYNPFKLVDGQHGSFWTSEINEKYILYISKHIENIFEKKVTNLHNYPLKASFYHGQFDYNRKYDEEMSRIFEKVLNTQFSIVNPNFGNSLSVDETFTGELTF